ncbi:MAG TPA: hypothetical protein VM534_07620 [Thermoanaerobaculia bacterium]|nr:hypothetical protein [Thermoanaerobaculia bacterium]
MSKKNNVNKDYYEHSHGRSRQGEEIVQEIQRQKLGNEKARTRRQFEKEREEGASPAPPEKV